MGRLYQRPAAAAFGIVLLATLATGCGAPRAAAPPGPPAATWPLATFLDTLDYRLAGVEIDGRALADEIGIDRTRGVRIAQGGAPEPIAPGLAASHRVVAGLGSGRVLIEVAAGVGVPPALALVEGGVVRPLTAPGARERLLGVTPDGSRVRIARETDAGEEIEELLPPATVRRRVLGVPAGFRAAAISDDALKVALVRAVHEESDEVILLDRRADERRLLLPTGGEGRFRPLGFAADGARLWFEADDLSDLPRLERITLATGAREVLLEASCLDRLPNLASDPVLVEAGCDGRRQVRWIGGEPRWRDLPLPESLGAGARVVQAETAGAADDWLVLAGARTSRDLARLPADLLLVPATRGLAPRLDPARLPAPEAVEPGNGLRAAELWPPTRAALGGVVWLLPSEDRPDYGRFEPFAAFLASRGFAVLRVAPRGAPGTGRSARAATDGDPAAATARDVGAALATLRRHLGSDTLPAALIGEGAWSGAIAAAVAAEPRSGFAAVVAIDPDADPLAPLDRVAVATEPLRSRGITRWGDPADPRVVARRRALATAAANASAPLLVILDSGRPEAATRAAELEAARLAGSPVRVVARPRPDWNRGGGRRALEASWRHLRETLVTPAAAR